MMIRKAIEEDIVQLMDIYNEAVLHTTATFDVEEKNLKNRQNWFYEHQGKYGLYAAAEGNKVLGFASLSPYKTRAAYEGTAEISVYVKAENRGQKTGQMLMERVLLHARESADIHNVIAVITSENEASIYLHHKLGFTDCGIIRDAGRKFGRYLDVTICQLLL